MSNNFTSLEVLKSGTSELFNPLTESELLNLIGGAEKCGKGYSFDDKGNLKCGCNYSHTVGNEKLKSAK